MRALKKAEETRRQAPPPAREEPAQWSAAQNLSVAEKTSPWPAWPIAVGLFTLLAAAGTGGYLWWQTPPRSVDSTTARNPWVPPADAAPAIPAAAPQPPFSTPHIDTAAPAPRAGKSPPAAPAPPASPIRITTGMPEVHPAIERAYRAFAAGDLAAARHDYERALEREPKNTDALHGLAAIALRQGRPEEAEELYSRVLEADPKDPAARAGLMGLRGEGDAAHSESRLKSALAEQPDSPVLHFALGNVYARQGRWREAQQAYFRAYAAESDHPDYQFNLAVSLERLRQPKLALPYYQGALAAAAHRPASFDSSLAADRIRELAQ